MKKLFALFLCILFISCNYEINDKITNLEDYNAFLLSNLNITHKNALSEKEFWSKRLRADSSGVGDLGPLARAYTQLFEATGEVKYLLDSERIYKKAIDISANNKDVFTRSLAQNYITQHRFIEAKNILEESYTGISNKHETELLLFDVYMELGEYQKAYKFLGKFKNNNDYNYLIRLAKWSDYKGNLEAAIRYMENAKKIAESSNKKPLQLWIYNNLADYYGHAGRVNDAYKHYLMTLQLQPDNAYAKKAIAWIVFSYEKNTQESNRIIEAIMTDHKAPDYFLLKTDIAEYEDNIKELKFQQQNFIKTVNDKDYGDMYNTYLIEIYSEINPEKAMQLAEEEVKNRATPETYSLLAYTKLINRKYKKALQIIENHVSGKTSNPKSLYYAALVYKANGVKSKVKSIRKELKTASFELGPILTQKISLL